MSEYTPQTEADWDALRGVAKELALVTRTCDAVEQLVRFEPGEPLIEDGVEVPRDAPCWPVDAAPVPASRLPAS